MRKLPSKINSISCYKSDLPYDFQTRPITYIINDGEEELEIISIKLPPTARPEVSNEIVSLNDKFVNGFKIVETANGEYAYIRESDGVLLPYRYDIATDFNDYGFAMVAKDGNASWINKNFRYFSRDGEMVVENIEDRYYKYSEFKGFQKIYKFSTGNYPLSKVYDGRGRGEIVFYFSTEGKIKEFYQFDGSFDYEFPVVSLASKDFGDKDYIINGYGIFFAKGYYFPLKYVLEFCEQNGIINTIYENADKCFNEEKGKTKILKPQK